MKNYSVKIINGILADNTGSVTLPLPEGEVTLPVPQIAKRKIPLNIEAPFFAYRDQIDGLSPKTWNVENLLMVTYPDGYYKEQFDIYFNSFGDREWLNLPDKRLELCMVRNGKPQKRAANETNTSPLDNFLNGNKNTYTNAIVHPANTSVANPTIFNTIYSGGNGQTSFGMPTEWKLDETNLLFSADGIGVYQSSLSRKNNPNITVELDTRNFFKIVSGQFGTLEYPVELDPTLDPNIEVRGLGRISKSIINQVYLGTSGNFTTGRVVFYKRNPTLFFRLSAGDPETAKLGSNAKYVFYNLDTFAIEGQTVTIDLGYGNTTNFTLNANSFSIQFRQAIGTQFPGKYRCKFNKNNHIVLEKLVNSDNLYNVDQFVPSIVNLNTGGELYGTQIRAADPATFYQKRIFSDLSQPIKLKLKIGKFFVDYNDPTLGYAFFAYGHKTTIG
jgi:hypothetical protein